MKKGLNKFVSVELVLLVPITEEFTTLILLKKGMVMSRAIVGEIRERNETRIK